MSDLFEAAAQAEREAVRLLLPRLRSDEAIQRRHLNDAMTKAFGGSDADGRWTQRASFELLEHALAIHLQSSAQKIAAFGDVRALIDLSDRRTHPVKAAGWACSSRMKGRGGFP